MLKLLALAALLVAAAAAPDHYPKIRDLAKTGSTLTSVTLSWTLDASEFVPVTYTLVVDGLLTMQFFHDGSNTYTANGLQSCRQYAFDLTADYGDGPGETANTIGSTDYEIPGPVVDLTVVGSIVSWTAPTNARCVDFYQVCYVSTVTDVNNCAEVVASTSYNLGLLSACDELDVTVKAFAGPLSGEASTVHVSTQDGVPGKVRDVEVVALTETSVLLAWNPPLENPACVQDYALIYGPETKYTTIEDDEDDKDDKDEEEMAEGPSGQKETAILDNLLPCTDYRFGVAAVSNANEYSEEVVVYLSTNETAPGMLPDVSYDSSEGSITISWGDVSGEACLAAVQICYTDPVELTFHCVQVPSSPNTWTLTGLSACREYTFRITGVSPDGLIGDPVVINVPTMDRAPGPVQNLALEKVEVTSLTLTYDPPLDYAQCVERYVVTYMNILEKTETRNEDTRAATFTTTIDGLAACAIYDVGVSAVSSAGIQGPVVHIRVELKQATPDPPSDGSLVDSTDTSLTVLWWAPADTRFCLDFYDVKLTRGGSDHQHEVPALYYKQVLETFPDLDPCTSYKVEIRSGNSDTGGHSPYATLLSDASTLC